MTSLGASVFGLPRPCCGALQSWARKVALGASAASGLFCFFFFFPTVASTDHICTMRPGHTAVVTSKDRKRKAGNLAQWRKCPPSKHEVLSCTLVPKTKQNKRRRFSPVPQGREEAVYSLLGFELLHFGHRDEIAKAQGWGGGLLCAVAFLSNGLCSLKSSLPSND